MNKITVEFNDVISLVNWAKRVAEDPQEALFGVTQQRETPKKKSEPPAKQEEAKGKTETPAAESNGKAEVPQLLVDIKEAGVKLTDMQPTRYEGVQVVLAKYGVTKIKELKEEDQPAVLKMFQKMADATKEKFAEMLDFLKQ